MIPARFISTPMFTHLTLDGRGHPPTKSRCTHPPRNPFDLGWPLITLKWLSKILGTNSWPPHQRSCPYTIVYPIWPLMTPDDLGVTFNIFGINSQPHPPSFMCIHQCLPHLTLDDPDDLEVVFKIVGINSWSHPPSFMSIHQCLPHLTLDDPDEVIFKIFSINNWPHPPSFMSINQSV